MAQPARDRGTTRRSLLLAGIALPLFRARGATILGVTYDGDNLYPVAPDVHFLTPKIVERLRASADTQAFVSQLSIFSGQTDAPMRLGAPRRFIVSYSIWEETFKVAIPGLGSQEGLSVAQAESWCMERMAISASGLEPSRPFRMRFELRSFSRPDLTRVLGDSGLSIVSLVDILSRKPGMGEQQWSRETGWLRLIDLPRLSGRPTHRG